MPGPPFAHRPHRPTPPIIPSAAGAIIEAHAIPRAGAEAGIVARGEGRVQGARIEAPVAVIAGARPLALGRARRAKSLPATQFSASLPRLPETP